MSGAKEIRTKIKSVKNTQKITRAMEMVAASKMRKAQELMQCSKPYASRIREVVAHVAKAKPEYQHLYLEEREIKNVGFIIVSSDRGLCGGLNVNLFKNVLKSMQEWEAKGVGVNLCLLGTKAETFFRRIKANIVASAGHFGDKPEVKDLIGAVKVMLDSYDDKSIDRLFIVSNEFVNTMVQKSTINQLLPLKADENQSDYPSHWDYLYEPDARVLLDGLLARYVEVQVYQAMVENISCEQAARMVAMKAASDNAGGLIDDLQLAYNKARQAAITQELSEIIGGAAAV